MLLRFQLCRVQIAGAGLALLTSWDSRPCGFPGKLCTTPQPPSFNSPLAHHPWAAGVQAPQVCGPILLHVEGDRRETASSGRQLSSPQGQRTSWSLVILGKGLALLQSLLRLTKFT